MKGALSKLLAIIMKTQYFSVLLTELLCSQFLDDEGGHDSGLQMGGDRIIYLEKLKQVHQEFVKKSDDYEEIHDEFVKSEQVSTY